MSIFHINQSAARRECIDIVRAHVWRHPDACKDTLNLLEPKMQLLGLGDKEMGDARRLLTAGAVQRVVELFGAIGDTRPRRWFVVAQEVVGWTWIAVIVGAFVVGVIQLAFIVASV